MPGGAGPLLRVEFAAAFESATESSELKAQPILEDLVVKKCLIPLILVWSLPMASLCETGVQHPLDSLTYEEHWTVLEVLRQAGRLDENTRFSRVLLAEPDKSYVRNWSAADPI